MFWNSATRPTPKQMELLGHATSCWGIIDHALTTLLSRLALTPDFLGLALVDELGFVPRTKAIANLIDIHGSRYGNAVVSADVLKELSSILAILRSAKDDRNRIAHTIWMRLSDTEMASIKLKGQYFKAGKPDPSKLITNDELASIIQDAEIVIDRLTKALDDLPEVAEETAIKSRR